MRELLILNFGLFRADFESGQLAPSPLRANLSFHSGINNPLHERAMAIDRTSDKVKPLPPVTPGSATLNMIALAPGHFQHRSRASNHGRGPFLIVRVLQQVEADAMTHWSTW